MKRTLAILIAVLMVLVLIPTTVFAAPDPGDPGDPGSSAPAAPALPAPDLATDFFEVLNAGGEHVGFYPDGNAGLTAADAALEDNYTLVVLQAVTLTDAFTFGDGRAQPISYTIDGTAASATAGGPVTLAFNDDDPLTFIGVVTLQSVKITNEGGPAVAVQGNGSALTLAGVEISCADTVIAVKDGGAVFINSGTYYRDGVSGSFIEIPGAGTATVNGGTVIMGSKPVELSTARDSMLFSLSHADATLNITGGDFVVNLDNFTSISKLKAIIQMANGTFHMTGGNIMVRGSAASNAIEVVKAAANASITIDGGYIYDQNGGVAIYLEQGANVTINGGYFESNGKAVLLADSWDIDGNGGDYNGALDHGFTINGGTFVLQPGAAFRSAASTDSVVSVEVNEININDGIFIDNSMTSAQVVNRTSTAGTMMIRGGLFMVSQAQSYFFKTVNGYTGPDDGDYRPRSNVPVVAASAPLVRYAGRNYYVYGSTMGNLLAPEVDPNATVRLYTDGDGNCHDGLLFTSTIKVAVYEALDIEINNRMSSVYAGASYYTIGYGTLVAPLDNILKTGGNFSAAAFAAYNATVAEADRLPYVVIPAVNGITVDANGDTRIRAALVGIDEDHYETFYTAQPYATITYYDNETDLNQIGEPWVIYPNLNTNRSVASLSGVCARELRDVKGVREGVGGEYRYNSVGAPGTYSRYSAAQQATLQSYIAHTHEYDYTGVCTICGDDLGTVLALDQTVTVYGTVGSVAYYKIHLTAGIPYVVNLGNAKVGSYALYDANGKACAIVDGKFNCTADGDYYLVFTANTLTTTTLSVSHVHNADYTGHCSICDEDLSIEIEVGERLATTVTKGETYYFHAALLASQYALKVVNGNYTVYDANGNVVPTENNVFTVAQAGTYYFVVTATFSAQASIKLDHVHNFGYTGVCSYPGCGEDVAIALTHYNTYSASHKNGDTVYFRYNVPADFGSDAVEGRKFTLTFNLGSTFAGTYALYDAGGEPVPYSGGYALNSGATYYLIVGMQYTGTLEVILGYTHEHTYRYDGSCITCQARAATWSQATLDQPMSAKYASDKIYYYSIANIGAGTDLTVTFSDGPTPWELYDANGNKVYDNTMGDAYTVTTAGAYYLVVTPTAASTAGATLTLATAATPAP